MNHNAIDGLVLSNNSSMKDPSVRAESEQHSAWAEDIRGDDDDERTRTMMARHASRTDEETAPAISATLTKPAVESLDRVTSLLRFNGTKDGPYKAATMR